MFLEKISDQKIQERIDYFRNPIGVLSGTIGPTDLKYLEKGFTTAAFSAKTLDPTALAAGLIEDATKKNLRNPLTLEMTDGAARLAAAIWGLVQNDPLLEKDGWQSRLLDHVLTAAGATLDRSVYCWVDAETTGNRRKDHSWEFCWSVAPWDAIEQATDIRDFYIKHTEKACEWVLKNTEYAAIWSEGEPDGALSPSEFADALIKDLEIYHPRDVYFVGAAAGFDRDHAIAIFETLGRPMPWDYHIIDIENLVMPLFDLKHPPTLTQTAKILSIPRKGKKHTAKSDMLLARDCHVKILKLQKVAAEAVKRIISD